MPHPGHHAIVAWNTTYIGLALEALAGGGAGVDQQLVGHLSPALLEHIRVYGTYTFDVDTEWRRTGYRPLRQPRPAATAAVHHDGGQVGRQPVVRRAL